MTSGYPKIILYQNSYGIHFLEIKLLMEDGFNKVKAF